MKRVSLFVLFFCSFLPTITNAQSQPVQTGTPQFGSFGGGPDVINLGNLNSHIVIPVLQKAGRGMAFNFNLSYDSSIWSPVSSSGTNAWTPVTVTNWGWTTSIPRAGYVRYTFSTESKKCSPTQFTIQTTYNNWTYYDGFGTPHVFPESSTKVDDECDNNVTTTSSTATAWDGSGYTLSINGISVTSLTASDGAVINAPECDGCNAPPTSGGVTLQDSNGNEITSANSSGTTSYYDTLSSSTPVLTISGSGTPTSPVVYGYTAPGGPASYTAKYIAYTVATNFGISGIAEYKATSVNLVSEIDLPDGSKYTLSYEPTPSTPTTGACTPLSGTYTTNCVTARLASITLPTGGTISYTYYNFTACTTGNNGVFSDGSASCLERTTHDGTWTYTRAGSGSQWTTTMADPQGNQTVIQFQEASSSTSFFETQRQAYQGSASSGTLLQTTNTCYNGSGSPCTSTAITLPISQTAQIIQLPGSSNLQCEHVSKFNSVGQLIEQDDYDYKSGGPPTSPIRQTIITYETLGSIISVPQTVEILNGSNVASYTSYNYDETSVVQTSGTPQQVPISGARGNLTSALYTIEEGSGTLKQTFTHFDTGNVDVATDVNGGTTTFAYGACGNSFVTGVTEAISTLTQSMTWNCTGGVETAVTDENGKTTSTTYTDPDFWRPASSTDQGNNVTNYTYASQNSLESALLFNGNSSTTDILTTLDVMGRINVTQRKQSPSATMYDSVETDYDSLGRPSRTTVPYSGTAAQTNGSAPATTQTYDGLNRPLVTTDGGLGTATLSYSANDVLQTIGPKAGGENLKERQSEYNSIGQLTSVCEITAGTTSAPAGTCAQNTSATGYWTQYTYDAMNRLLTVTQNAQSSTTQSRKYTYDDLGRMLSETNPETGAINYVYDTDSSGACTGTYNGDLVKRIDAAGNVTCYTYDALHRPTSITYPSGPNSGSNSPNKCFVYDAAIDSETVTNTKARLAEAYTTTSACSNTTLPATVTDEAFSYSVRGEVATEYESTPHSGGYYTASATYWANGLLDTLTGTASYSTTYTPDGEGRVNSAAGAMNQLKSTTYNAASEPLVVTLGNSDSDTFTYDPSTFRMTQYKYTIGATPQSLVGNLTWNPNGTLQQLAISDPFNSTNTQTCNYTHDDLARVASGNCGSVWSQTFTYDAFGNITKAGTNSFNPGYNTATNRMSTGATYDLNGDVLTDSLHSYAWDVETRPTTIDTVTATYDAFGRMVEQTKAGVSTEIQYSPTGFKMQVLNGQTVKNAYVPLPDGTVLVPQCACYFHADWLGGSRFASTYYNRTMYNDLAFAPFGEQYAQMGGTGVGNATFAGNRNDTTTNLYDAQFREYEIYGRWPSHDPAGIAAASPANPQSWNRYAYVLNNPLLFVDPSGLEYFWKGNCFYYTQYAYVDGHYDSSDDFLVGCSVLPGGGPGGQTGATATGSGSGSGSPSSPQAPTCGPTTGPSIISGNATTNIPTIAAGGFIGGLIGGEPGAFIGGIIGSFFGVGGNVSYVPSTQSLYAGPTIVFAPALGGGNGFSASGVYVPSSQNPNSIANGLSFSTTFQPLPFLGSTVVKTPGSGPPVVGPGVGTRVPASFGASFNFSVVKGCK